LAQDRDQPIAHWINPHAKDNRYRLGQSHRVWRALLVLLLVAVSYLSLTPAPPQTIDLGWDKLNHLAAFSALAIAASLGFPTARRTRLLLLFLIFGYGGLIEALQQFVPGRFCEWGDLLADSLGIGLGALMASVVVRTVSSPAPPT
jgi:VanZ family protein